MKRTLRLLLLAGFSTVAAYAAYQAGGVAYTKKLETPLLAEPKPLASPAGKLALGVKVKVEQVQGAWVRVASDATAGWVFGGNLSETQPDEGAKLDGVAFMASKTTATAATRGLDEDVVKYAEQRNLPNARADLEWLQATAAGISEADVDAFLQEAKKGEYQ